MNAPRPEELLTFTRTLARGMATGTPLLPCLQQMAEHETSPALRDLERDLVQAIDEGQIFSEALARHPEVFDAFFVTMVQAGELSGTLDTTLEQLASKLQSERTNRGHCFILRVYFGVILTVAALVAAALVLKTWTAPGTISHQFMQHFPLLAGAAASLLLIFWLARRTRLGRRWVDHCKLHAPVFGTLTRHLAAARCFREVGLLLSHHVPVLQALRVAQQTAGNAAVSDAVAAWHDVVKEGEDVTAPLRDWGFWPGPLRAIVDTPDNPWPLPNQLSRLADDFENDLRDRCARLNGVAVPLMVVLLTLVAGCLTTVLLLEHY
jgi:type IV pilus assembly protein PilC